MKNFTEEQMTMMTEQTNLVMERLAEGVGVREIMARMYMEGLEDKTMEQGEVMAESILESIAGFDADYAQATADADSYMDACIAHACEGKTLAQRCTWLTRMVAAVAGAEQLRAATTGEEKAAIRETIAAADANEIQEGEATEELAAQLTARLKDALSHNQVMTAAVVSQADALQEVQDAGQAAMLVDAGARHVDFRAIMSMIAYVNVKKGLFENMPADMTAAEVATMVCVHKAEAEVTEALDAGKIAEGVAFAALTILGVVAIMRTLLAMNLIVVGAVSAIAATQGILMIPAIVVAVSLMAIADWKIVSAWTKASQKIVHVGAIAVRAIVNLGRRLFTAAKPVAEAAAGRAMAFTRRVVDAATDNHTRQAAGEQTGTLVVDEPEQPVCGTAVNGMGMVPELET